MTPDQVVLAMRNKLCGCGRGEVGLWTSFGAPGKRIFRGCIFCRDEYVKKNRSDYITFVTKWQAEEY